ncbi:LysE family transporter [Sinomonas susongensis]|uniref:LysE family transporter n=1 Tax=Sinomonas susongensis TaxID=1324851 RepID=UPI00110822DC|nr:LysE family transporter [Sinomonas susongensis]
MPFSIWAALLGACLLISFTPGAGAINTMSNSLNAGFRRAFWGILGQQAALVVHLAIVAAGIGVLVASSPIAFNVIRYLGAAYLVYLGIRQILRRPDASAAASAPLVNESALSMAQRGLWVNLLNPKAIVFFLAFIPGFVKPELPLWSQYLVIGATIVGVDIVVMWFFFALAAKSFQRFTRNEGGQRVLDRIFGLLFVGVGILLAAI